MSAEIGTAHPAPADREALMTEEAMDLTPTAAPVTRLHHGTVTGHG